MGLSSGVWLFGETEFWLSGFKLLILMALAFFGVIVNLGGNPNHEIIGFRYWIEPGPMGTVWSNIIINPHLARLMSLGSASGECELIELTELALIGATSGGNKCIFWR